MRLSRFAILAGLLTAVFAAGSALADIKGYNAAVKAGDHKTATIEAKEIWKMWDKAKADTALMAREFGFTAYMAGDYAAARDFGQFLKEQGPSLATPDDQPATSRVLLAAANFRLGADDGTRKELLEALKAREAASGLDTTTLVAAEALYRADWREGRWGQANESGMLAYRLLSRGSEVLAPRALEARLSAAAAGFLGGRDRQDYGEVMDAHDAIIKAIDAAKDPKRRASLVNLSFNMQAWGMAIYQYFDSSEQISSNIPVKVKARPFTHPQGPYFPGEIVSAEINSCSIDINERAINYPSASLFAGTVGTVIMRMDVDAEGRITHAEPLASVPAAHFANAVMDAVPRLRASRAGGDPGCTLARKDWVLTLTFKIL